MANNLFVAYDLNKEPNSTGYPKLVEAIKKLGTAVNIQKSMWYVSSTYSAESACDLLSAQIDSNDFLIVVDAKNAWWAKLLPDSGKQIQNNWNK